MKTPEAIKEGLARHFAFDCDLMGCPYVGERRCGETLASHALCYIKQLESNYSQVSKTLCGKENATLEEVLQAVSQVKAELEAVKRERDAAVSELPHHCWNCKNHLKNPIEETDDYGRTIHRYCDADCCFPDEENSSWEWRGVCPENTEVKK